jgi:hypothetical protein
MRRNLLSVGLLVVQLLLFTGCTAMLWNKSTFSTYYHPAEPANLQLYYSDARKDMLVQYDESCEREKKVQRRSYWLEPNLTIVNNGQKPQFVDAVSLDGLTPVPLSATQPISPPTGFKGLYVVCQTHDPRFTLYSGTNELNSCILPIYRSNEQIAVKVLLTPPALVADATLVGGLIGLYVMAHSDSDDDTDFPDPKDYARKPHKKPNPANP